MNLKIARILMIEDCEADIDIVKHTLQKNKMQIDIQTVCNGKDGLDYIFQKNKFENAKKPDLILLDIHLPDMNGIEILKIIKKDENTRIIPVIILTSSKNDEDILRSYSNHANCFMQKPLKKESFLEIIATVENFWLTIVTLPKHE